MTIPQREFLLRHCCTCARAFYVAAVLLLFAHAGTAQINIGNVPVFTRIAIDVNAHEGRWAQLIVYAVLFATYENDSLAMDAAQESLKVAESNHDDVRIATSLHYLAILYEGKRMYGDAERLAQRSLSIREKLAGASSPGVADELMQLARLYAKDQKFAEAEPLYERARLIREQVLGANSAPVADAIFAKATLLQSQHRYADAETGFRKALQIQESVLGPEDLDVADTLDALGALFAEQNQFEDAGKMYSRALPIREKWMGAEDPSVLPTLEGMAALDDKTGGASEAAEIRQQVKKIRDSALGASTDDKELKKRLAALTSQSFALFSSEEIPENIRKDREALRFVEVYAGNEDWRAGLFLTVLAQQYWSGQGAYTDAERLMRRAIRIQEKALGTEDPSVAETLGEYASLDVTLRKYQEAEDLYKRAIRIHEATLRIQVPEDNFMRNPRAGLAWVYQLQGRYAEAEALFEHSLQIMQADTGPEKPKSYATANIMKNLANVYEAQGKFTKAEPLVKQATDLDDKAFGLLWKWTKDSVASGDVAALGSIYVSENRLPEAETLYKQALALAAKKYSQNSGGRAGADWNLARVYVMEEKYGQAESLLQKELLREDQARLTGQADGTARNLAWAYMADHKYAEAQALLTRALKYEEANADPDSPTIADTLTDLGTTLFRMGQPKEGDAFFQRSFAILAHRVRDYFTYMSESDRLQLLSTIDYKLSNYFTFAEQFQNSDPELAGPMYDLLLWHKGMVVRSIASLRGRIFASGGEEARNLLDELAARKTQISALMSNSSGSAAWHQRMATLKDQADQVERKLVAISQVFAHEDKEDKATWQKVHEGLAPAGADAAIEFVRFPVYDGKRWSAHYDALVLTLHGEAPAFVALGNSDQLEGAPLKEYYKLVGELQGGPASGAAPSPAFYDAFWKPIEPLLAGTKTVMGKPHTPVVFVSPDGILDEVSLSAVPGDDGEPLLVKYDLRIVSSTRDLTGEPRTYSTKTAVLLGNPNYALTDAQYQAELMSLEPAKHKEELKTASDPESHSDDPVTHNSCETNGNSLEPLPGTAGEIDSVNDQLDGGGWKTEVLTGDKALVEAIRGVHARVFYLATHGCFEQDRPIHAKEGASAAPTVPVDPMLRSKLYFAGADRSLHKETIPEGQSDGVLTALEASTLDLHDTEMVVLSACETGLGQVENGEGVFGLFRAFQEAGAESVVMSMWKVDDFSTQQLMTLFFRNWLSGMNKHEALRQAQLSVLNTVQQRSKSNLPYYWGAFILVGGNEHLSAVAKE
jgi:CHAT domain-containing protein/tetratricopeptide (TPR) repeat protein